MKTILIDPSFLFREKLIEIIKPKAVDWQSLSVVRANTKPKRKLAPKNRDR